MKLTTIKIYRYTYTLMEVACAIIIKDGLIFIAQRPLHKNQGGKWEFPGGKKFADESLEDCVKREITEELGITISVISKLNPEIHQYPNFQIQLTPFICAVLDGKIVLKEHINSRWVSLNELKMVDFCEADKKVILEIMSFFNT